MKFIDRFLISLTYGWFLCDNAVPDKLQVVNLDGSVTLLDTSMLTAEDSISAEQLGLDSADVQVMYYLLHSIMKAVFNFSLCMCVYYVSKTKKWFRDMSCSVDHRISGCNYFSRCCVLVCSAK